MELERIERENQKIAKKIFCLKSNLNKNEFRKDFIQHEAIKNNLARMKKKRMPQYEGRPGLLPPIDDNSTRQGSAPTNNARDSIGQHRAPIQNGSGSVDYHSQVISGTGAGVDNSLDIRQTDPANPITITNRNQDPPTLHIKEISVENSEPPASRKVATVDERQSEQDDASPKVANAEVMDAEVVNAEVMNAEVVE